MHLSSNLRLAPVIGVFLLCSCQSSRPTLPPVTQVPIRNETPFPEYIWGAEQAKGYPTKPQAIVQGSPAFPRAFAGRGIIGTAVIEWVIEPDGSTSHVQILEASDRTFGEAAKMAVEKWIFTPALFEGRAVAIKSKQLFEFREVTKSW